MFRLKEWAPIKKKRKEPACFGDPRVFDPTLIGLRGKSGCQTCRLKEDCEKLIIAETQNLIETGTEDLNWHRYNKDKKKRDWADIFDIFGGIGAGFLLVGGSVTVYALLFAMQFFATGIIIFVSMGVPMVAVYVLMKTHTEGQGTEVGMKHQLIENARLICEKLEPEFSNPIKMDIYERDHREPLFSPPSTITIYEEIDKSKEPEKKPNVMAPRYEQLGGKKKKLRGRFVVGEGKLGKFALFIGLEAGPLAAINGLKLIEFLRSVTNEIALVWLVSGAILVPILVFSWTCWYSFIRGITKPKAKNIEKRMLCAFREGTPYPVLIINDVKEKVERPIIDVFNRSPPTRYGDVEITYQDRQKDEKDYWIQREQTFGQWDGGMM